MIREADLQLPSPFDFYDIFLWFGSVFVTLSSRARRIVSGLKRDTSAKLLTLAVLYSSVSFASIIFVVLPIE